jgi:hypothetical protein
MIDLYIVGNNRFCVFLVDRIACRSTSNFVTYRYYIVLLEQKRQRHLQKFENFDSSTMAPLAATKQELILQYVYYLPLLLLLVCDQYYSKLVVLIKVTL